MANRSGAMSSEHTRRALLAFATAGAVALAGCGSGAIKTVSVSGTFSPHTTARHTTSTTTTSGTSPTTATAPTTRTGAAASPSGAGGAQATRTTTAPAFTRESTGNGGGEGVAAAVASVRARGYTVADTSTYRPEDTLRVLIGTRSDSSDGYGQQAFFFVDGSYIGTDAKQPSASVRVVGQSDTEVTLAYPLYRPGDPLGHPSGGESTVRFQLDNGQLTALDPIPPASSATGTSRN